MAERRSWDGLAGFLEVVAAKSAVTPHPLLEAGLWKNRLAEGISRSLFTRRRSWTAVLAGGGLDTATHLALGCEEVERLLLPESG
ncbi:MAG: hypothetical protein IPL28_13220 [Chloroflexi bacterium]|nr:hypothetical protein [Chloroflexota bacterium]